jgi:NAD(P)-dependent dehydrogenase (short-subunit alcohol dehydrogenase family)
MGTTSRLNGKVVAITGGARGIGLATAKAFAESGAKVAIGDLDVDEATRAASGLPVHVVAQRLDVRSAQSFAAFLDDVELHLGPLDILVNNAGVMLTGAFLEESPATAELTIDVNLRGVLLGCRLAAERFARRGHGSIVNLASMAGIGAFPGVATYCATKFGVVGLTLALRQELRPHGVHVCAILPGVVHTELSAGVRLPEVVKRFVSVDPGDIARAVVAATQRNSAVSYVPGRLRVALRASSMLPERPRQYLARLTRTDQVYLAVDDATRTAYHDRVVKGTRR